MGTPEIGQGTHSLKEMQSPPLVLPRKLRRALEANQELALKVEQLVEIGEEEMDGVLVNQVALRQCCRVFLPSS